MPIPKLTKLGFCDRCERWLELENGANWLPSHETKGTDSAKCHNSRYSPSEKKYLVKTGEEAQLLAEFIKNDKGHCLHGYGSRHSLTCGDGRDCAQVRLGLAQALAVFYLETERDKRALYDVNFR